MAPEILRGPGSGAVAPDVDVFRLPRRGAAGGLRLSAHRLLHGDGRLGAARRRRPGARGDATPVETLPDGARLTRLLRGGFWRNFLVKYPEMGDAYAIMLALSRRLHEALRARPDDP